ncbi:hypothetical protein HPB51_026538 [Rhipicephalus microplus]|uniref:Uncharacterized protein n=1 Tax=Rhipicephalus microplus TaxID=6941 RepID=A0A9J6D2M6_RHIMP|nr:hypothetical protein HPB51_026538 [Rhipicephalus microplus]
MDTTLRHHMLACLRPANTIHYKSPLTNKFVFLDRIAKGKDGLEDLYHIVNVTASFLIPQPKVPRGTARASPCGDNGDGCNIAVNRVSLVRPVSADVPLLLWSLWRKKSIPEEMRLLLEMHMLFQPRDVLRPDDEIDALLLQDYAIFEKEMKERLDGCSQAIGEDVEGILAVNPAPLAKKLVDHILSMAKEAQELKKASDDYLAATSAVATKTQFAPGKSSVGNVTVACSTSQTYVDQCDTITKAREHLQKQTSQFSQASKR